MQHRFYTFLLTLLLASLANGQPPSDATTPAPDPAQDNGHVSKRLFGILPNYKAADQQAVYVHPSVREKFKIAAQNSFDWPNFFTTAGFALQNQVAQKGLHQTAFGKNFAEYYARGYADSVIGNFVTQGVLPSLLSEDPRYYRMATGTGWHRTLHALAQIVITRGVSGGNRIHLSELAGNAGVVAVTNLYYPDQNHGLVNSVERWGFALGNDAISNLLNEWLPDLDRKLRNRHHH